MTTKVIGPELADVPQDGGKWAIYHEHYDADGEITYTAVCQDTNKRRLAAWKRSPVDWCDLCQEIRDGGNINTLHGEPK